MDKIISLRSLIAQLLNCSIARQNKIVLATGCFDVLHKAHKDFLKIARKKGSILIVGLESDIRVKQLKGKSRPVNNWQKRAKNLAKIKAVDFVFPLPKKFFKTKDHLKLLRQLKSDILAVSQNTPHLNKKKKLIEKIGGKLFVYPYNRKYSTTDIIKKLPQRKSIRLPNYDYKNQGYYFVTICVQNRLQLFGHINNKKMILNNIGKLVEKIWYTIPNHHLVELDIFQIMPNHIHFIIRIVGATRGSPVTRGWIHAGGSRPHAGGSRPHAGGSRPAPTGLGTIVGLFKSECTKQIRRMLHKPNMVIWQRNFYERIIRNKHDLNKIRFYIKNNPKMWHRDRNNQEIYQN